MTIFNVFFLCWAAWPCSCSAWTSWARRRWKSEAVAASCRRSERLTDSPLKVSFWVLCVTAIIETPSATTVMVVGFVNSGIMELHQAIGVIMGSNVGTTVTSWITEAFPGLQG